MNKRLIKKLILTCFIIIIIVVGLIIYLNNRQKQTDNKKIEEMIEKTEEIDGNIMLEHEGTERFYTVAQCVSYYLDIINKNNQNYFGYDENQEYVKIINQNEKIYNILSKDYIEKNNITINNVEKVIQTLDEKMMFVPLKMNFVSSRENLYQYIVYGFMTNMEYNTSNFIYIIINFDLINETFSVEPLKENIDNIDKVKLKGMDNTIEPNEDNIIEYKIVNDENVAITYMDYYKKMALSNPKLAYEYLDNEYREERFGNVENYIQYIEKNKEEIKQLQIKKYLVNGIEEYMQYVCQDKYENIYIFNERAPMDFSIQLDTYTIPTEKFKKEYDKSNDQKRIMLNIDKWVQMLNNRDYSAAYAVLDETFRNNKFGSEEKFEQFIREKLPLHYKVEFGEYSNETDIGMQKITFTDITGENLNVITTTIIMQLKDNYDFIMSFEV